MVLGGNADRLRDTEVDGRCHVVMVVGHRSDMGSDADRGVGPLLPIVHPVCCAEEMRTMVRSLMCWLGMHDWQVVESAGNSDISYRASEPEKLQLPRVPPDPGETIHKRRVCLNCGCVDDQIARAVEKEKHARMRARQRISRANAILNGPVKS